MEKSCFIVNRKIEIIFDEKTIGSSLIQEVHEDSIFITPPLVNGQQHLLRVGETIEGIYYFKNELYGFNGKVIDKKIENISLYKIQLPQEFKRLQRRNYVRIPTTFEIEYGKDPSLFQEGYRDLILGEFEEKFKGYLEKGFTVDMSGGGMQLRIKNPLKKNEKIIILLKHLLLDMVVKGRVTRCLPLIVENKMQYDVGIEFIDISEILREKIIRFVFMKMREIRKKGYEKG